MSCEDPRRSACCKQNVMVTDVQMKKPIRNATVKANPKAGGSQLDGITDSAGLCTFYLTRNQQYDISAIAVGYKSLTMTVKACSAALQMGLQVIYIGTTVNFKSSVSGAYLHCEGYAIHKLLPASIDLKCDVDYQFEIQKPEKMPIMYTALRVAPRTCVISCLNVDGHKEYCGRTIAPGMVVINATKTVIFYPPTPTPTPPIKSTMVKYAR